MFSTGAATDGLLDIAVGADGAEVVKLANLDVGFTTTTAANANMWEFPLFIPAGSRIAIRCQARITVDTVDAAMDLFYGGRFTQYSGAPSPQVRRCRCVAHLRTQARSPLTSSCMD
jgi:hypothetical protein